MVKQNTTQSAPQTKAEKTDDKPKRVIRSYDERIAELQAKAEAKKAKDLERAEKNYDTLVSEFQIAGQKLEAKGQKLAEAAELLGKAAPTWSFEAAVEPETDGPATTFGSEDGDAPRQVS